MTTNRLQQLFLRLCQEYAGSSGAVGTALEPEKKAVAFGFLYRNVKLQMVYRSKATVGTPVSTLYCRVFLSKNRPIWLHIPQLLPLLGIEDYRACYFPFIESEQRMRACFRALTAFWEELRPGLERMASSGQDRELLLRYIDESGAKDVDPEKILQNGSDEQNWFRMIQGMQDPSFVTRYTQWSPWVHYLKGNHSKALAQYRKQKELLPYETGLCAFLETPEGKNFVPMPSECFAQRDMQAVQSGFEDGGTLFKGMLLLYPLCAAAGCLFMGLLQLIYSLGTLCWLGAPWYWGFMLGVLPALFGGIALRRRLIPIMNRKTGRQQLEFDDIINNSPGTNRFLMGTFWVFTAITLFLGLMVSQACLRLYPDRGDLDTGFLGRETFHYEDISGVYRIQARYNDYGDRIERESYVIVMEDGRQIDLDGYGSLSETEEKVLPILGVEKDEVMQLDSDRDFPKKP